MIELIRQAENGEINASKEELAYWKKRVYDEPACLTINRFKKLSSQIDDYVNAPWYKRIFWVWKNK